MVVWIMGLSGSGKSAVAKELSEILSTNHTQNLILDGNHLREVFEEDGYDRASRIALGARYVDLAKALSEERSVIIAANGMLKEVSTYARTHLKDYIEVYLQTPAHILEQRDSKKIYSRFKKGEISNVGGLDFAVDTPNADIIIDFNQEQSPKDIAKYIFKSIHKSQIHIKQNKAHQDFFSTKAKTLKNLANKNLKTACVLPIWIVNYKDFVDSKADAESRFVQILKELQESKYSSFIVRSSSRCEDTLETSNAGAFLSLLDVGVDSIASAVEQVFNSYKKAHNSLLNEEVLIQPMAQNIILSGVAFNFHPKSFAPYYIIEYSYQNTYAVTSGGNVKRFIQSHFAPCKDSDMQKIVAFFKELDCVLPLCPVDVEFGIDDKGVLYIFQIRPLIINAPKDEINEAVYQRIEHKVASLLKPQPFLYGDKGILAIMPDWNPAEIIGVHPRPLAFSLYRELITDEIWAKSRAELGYNDVTSNPLIFSIAGYPYVDVRASFCSFIPHTLESNLAKKLVNFYLDRLRTNPQYHDKVEFEIIFCAYYFDSDKKLEILEQNGFSSKEINTIQKELKFLTNTILLQKPYEKYINKLHILQHKRDKILSYGGDGIQSIFWLLKDCKSYGTLSFAVLARMGFMAVSFLDSLVRLGILSKEEKNSFINSLEGITSQFNKDLNTLKKEVFLEKYGHLRPGTYDILSPSYQENFEMYFLKGAQSTFNKEEFRLSLSQMNTIEQLLKEQGFGIGALEFFEFLRIGIMYREIAKFEFSKNISLCLEYITKVGKKYGLHKDDMSFCDVRIFLGAFGTSDNIERLILESIAYGKRHFYRQEKILLPPIIFDAQDIYGFYSFESLPNFITHKRIQASVVRLDSHNTQNLNGKIVCIASADPGFDWIFSHNIAGLITEFGGANSHMAIRANELGIPAVIGCGEKFEALASAQILDIDCANAKIEVLV